FLTLGAVVAHRLRSGLCLLGVAIGIAAVILLTSIGEGTRVFILSQATQFGTNLLAVTPGKTKTIGVPGVLGGSTHKLTLEDARALLRVPGVERVVPLAFGTARVAVEGRGRSVTVFGVTADMPEMWKFTVRQGTFLPGGDIRRRTPVAVLGPKLKQELFADANALGRFVRIAGYRYRVIGVMAPKGQMLGFDIDDAVYVPVASAMKMFNLDELVEVDVTYSHERDTDRVVERIRQLLIDRHRGTEDFTIITQAAMLAVLDNVMRVVTLAVGAIAGISLIVGAIGILTVMWIAVGERTSEVGLLLALGATPGQVYRLFLSESVLIAAAGGAAGLSLGLLIVVGLQLMLPGLPVRPETGYLVAAVLVSICTGLLAGFLPAHRAATIDPVEALHKE
ncbi:MAG: ABC transporter permease, partial [Nitrospiraceae bacterium]